MRFGLCGGALDGLLDVAANRLAGDFEVWRRMAVAGICVAAGFQIGNTCRIGKRCEMLPAAF